MIAVGVEAPSYVQVDATVDTSFYKGFLAVTNIIFAYGAFIQSPSLKVCQ